MTIGKSKGAAVAAALQALNTLLGSFGLPSFHLTPEQVTAITGLIVSLWAWGNRDAQTALGTNFLTGELASSAAAKTKLLKLEAKGGGPAKPPPGPTP